MGQGGDAESGRRQGSGGRREVKGGGRRDRGSGRHFRSCFAKRNEIFLIFRSKNSNLVTWMSQKARNEPGWRIARGCVRQIQLYRNI